MATKKQIETRVAELKKYDKAYYTTTKPLISDAKYDELRKELQRWDPSNIYFDDVGAVVVSGDKYTHTNPMLSTSKTWNAEQLQDFVNRVLKEAAEIGVKKVTFKVTPKLDGMAGKYKGKILATRGNGRVGNDVTHIFKLGVVPIGGKKEGVGEIVLSQSYFDEYLSDEFAHPRNVVVGAVNADKVRPIITKTLKAGKLHFVRYDTLPTWTGSGENLVKKVSEITQSLAAKVDYPLDGMVAEVVQAKVKKYMGANNHHHRWQTAIKAEGEVKETKVLDIGWQTGRTGKITPVLRLETIEVDGANISNVTAHHAGNVRNLKLGKGAKVNIIRSGGVIPKIKSVTKTAKVSIPDKCSVCNGSVEWTNDFLYCTNKGSCPKQAQTGLFYFFTTIETAKGFGPKTLETLVSNGHDSIESVFALKEEDFVQMEFGKKQAHNLAKALREGIATKIEDARFLAAFGIEDLGLGASRKLLAVHPLDTLNTLDQKKINNIDGFGEKTSGSIATALKAQWSTIEHIKGLGFDLNATPLTSEFESIESPIAGKTILFTGKMNQNRDDMEVEARGLGAKVVGSVSGKLQILVTGSKASAGKISKAKNATVYTEAEYNKLIGK